MTTEHPARASGPIVFAYDGSELAKLAIDEAGQQLAPGRDALVLTVWQPFDVGFLPVGGLQFDAAQIGDVRKAAEQTAADGASLAEAAGFRAQSVAVEASPSWKAIAELADDRDASLIVLGPRPQRGSRPSSRQRRGRRRGAFATVSPDYAPARLNR
jgi:nucleotide-binding universal stress UspA family protein